MHHVRAIVVRLVLVCFGFALIIALLEGFARIQQAYRAGTSEEAHNSVYFARQLLHNYPDLSNDYFRWREVCKNRFRDYYYLSFECHSKTLNTTSYYDSRAVPASAPIGKASVATVWLFGGSTMLNLTSPDELTVANHVAEVLNKQIGKVAVVNFGMGAFGLRQEKVKFIDLMSRVASEERPNLAIFYDGFNDAGDSFTFGPGNFPEDMNGKLRLLVEENDRLLPLFLSHWLSHYSVFWSLHGAPAIDAAFANYLVQSRPQVNQDFHFAVSVYEADADAIRRFAKAYGIKTLFVLQPMIFTKTPLSEFERSVMAEVVEPNKPHLEYMRQWYSEAQSIMRGHDDFADLTHVLDGRQNSDFFDHGHTGPEASEPIGIALAREAEKMLHRK